MASIMYGTNEFSNFMSLNALCLFSPNEGRNNLVNVCARSVIASATAQKLFLFNYQQNLKNYIKCVLHTKCASLFSKSLVQNVNCCNKYFAI